MAGKLHYINEKLLEIEPFLARMSADSELLSRVEEGLHMLTIASEHPSSHHRYTQLLPNIPITCLKIPKSFLLQPTP